MTCQQRGHLRILKILDPREGTGWVSGNLMSITAFEKYGEFRSWQDGLENGGKEGWRKYGFSLELDFKLGSVQT